MNVRGNVSLQMFMILEVILHLGESADAGHYVCVKLVEKADGYGTTTVRSQRRVYICSQSGVHLVIHTELAKASRDQIADQQSHDPNKGRRIGEASHPRPLIQMFMILEVILHLGESADAGHYVCEAP